MPYSRHLVSSNRRTSVRIAAGVGCGIGGGRLGLPGGLIPGGRRKGQLGQRRALREAGVPGVVYVSDHDTDGEKRATTAAKAAGYLHADQYFTHQAI